MPTTEQILDRYVAAMGGSANLKKLLSRVMTGTISVPSMQLSGTVEIHEKAPNRTLGTITINGASYRQGFDGTAGWTDDPANGLRDQTGDELAETRRESDFYHALDLHELYSKFTLVGKEKVGERDAYVIEATLPEGGPPEKLYFDVESGLVLRDSSQRHGPDGVSEFQQDYEDYRDVDGVKLPFTIRQTNEGTLVIITVTEYHHNVPLDDSQFVKPAAQ
jgi:zinc protease